MVFLTVFILSSLGPKNLMAHSEMTIALGTVYMNNKTDVLLSNQQDPKTTEVKSNDSFITNQAYKTENTVIDNIRTDDNAITKFQQEFCGLDSETNSNTFVTEYILPQTCEMPLGIAIDSDAKKVWYVSTKKGVLGSYDMKERKFDGEHAIPEWSSRADHNSFSQAWDMKVDRKSGDIWFTDEKENAIRRYIRSSQDFEIYRIPGQSENFGTTYPISIEFATSDNDDNNIKDIDNDSDNKANTIFFVGTYSQSLWYADITKLKNGTSEGISEIPFPISSEFKGIDPIYITTGSLAYDSKRHAVWTSVMGYSKKGQILRYDLDTKTFDTFDLPKEISSPLGMGVDERSGDLWITNPGTSIFYKFKSHKHDENNFSILKFVTSKVSPRIFSNTDSVSSFDANIDKITNISKHAYTLPYWIKKSGKSLWFNEWEGNKIARFDPLHGTLIEYWIPTQNSLWGICSSFDNTTHPSANNNNNQKICGITSILQFSIEKHDNNNNYNAKQIWFSEWSENKIGKVDVSDRHLPFSVDVSYSASDKKVLTIKRGESEKIKIKVKPAGLPSLSSREGDNTIYMMASGTFTPTGDLGNTTAHFSKDSFTIDDSEKKKEKITFIFTPATDLKPGNYTLMIGAENNAVSFLKAILLNIT
jgi:virginiamycin B lyase